MKKAKFLGAMLALVMVTTVQPLQAGAASETTAPIRNGETIHGDVDVDYPEEYNMAVSREGDLILDLRTDGGVYVELVNSEGRHVAAKEYKKTEAYYSSNMGKEDDNSGRYYLQARYGTVGGYFTFHVKPGAYRIILSTPFSLCFTELTATVLSTTATPNRSMVLVNGESVDFDAYTIEQNNYFKLRDLAKVLSGTAKEFEVEWNSEKNAISMTTGQTYTTVGGELAAGDGTDKTANLNTATIYLDGVPVQLTAYTINQNNYFKLRDVGQALGFDVSWNGLTDTIVVDTTKGYTPG